MYKLTAADFADTGQWRLLLNISTTGLDAFLENVMNPEIELQALCSVNWEQDKDRLLQNIEDAVYNNPRLLDDFSTRIVLFDSHTLFIPTEIAEKTSEAENDLYKKVYTAENRDIMTDTDSDITAVWSMAPGIKSFLMRTFPGALITSNLMNKVKTLRNNSKGIQLHAIARKGEVDIILIDNNRLISASTHEWMSSDDIAFLLLNLLDIYDYNISVVNLFVEGTSTESDAWKHIEGKIKGFTIINDPR